MILHVDGMLWVRFAEDARLVVFSAKHHNATEANFGFEYQLFKTRQD